MRKHTKKTKEQKFGGSIDICSHVTPRVPDTNGIPGSRRPSVEC
jgi:hypothetical protein